MKRILIVVILAVLCIAAVGYRPVHEAWTRRQYRDEAVKNEIPLVLDVKTQAILSGANRVETFRLVDDDVDEDEVGAPVPVSPALSMHHYQVLRIGPTQGKAFAAALRAALAQTPSPLDKNGLMSEIPSCFEPGVAFRIWKDKAHIDLCVCFHCGGVQIFTQNGHHTPSQEVMANLGVSRSAFLALSKQAFLQDVALARLN